MKKNTIFCITCCMILLGGCLNQENENAEMEKQRNKEDEQYISVQDYDGEGYTLRGGQEEAVDIAEQHKEEIVKAVEKFFLENYKIEVKVNHFIGAKDAVSVTVESVNKPFFYSYAIVPVDFKSKTVATDQVFTLEGEVEQDIQTGLYAMAYEEEFSNLDKYLEKIEKEHPIISINKTAIQNTNIIRGYAKPYYFISIGSYTMDELFDRYMKNPTINKKKIKKFLISNPIDPEYITISIEFFMEAKDVEPDQKIFNMIVKDIKEMADIPKGSYSIFLNDNDINKQTAMGKNAISVSYPDSIIKE
ncbi:DUF1672 family protein [Cerasibacillus terrae]|uniref:DUF1672 family protein n=1 Tax=Cerasibacillus terrae TaxID=2498845 RepID=A0A5C8P0F6_9BACI|nr:DUF1672 family protein [Cerasibacillus terrae]TXL66736.1 DUF1672 family protein [Cerasibacillus terrae]